MKRAPKRILLEKVSLPGPSAGRGALGIVGYYKILINWNRDRIEIGTIAQLISIDLQLWFLHRIPMMEVEEVWQEEFL